MASMFEIMSGAFHDGSGGSDGQEDAYYRAQLQEWLRQQKYNEELDARAYAEQQAQQLQQQLPGVIDQAMQTPGYQGSPAMNAALALLKGTAGIGSPLMVDPIQQMLAKGQAGLVSAGTPTLHMKEAEYEASHPGFLRSIAESKGHKTFTPASGIQYLDRLRELRPDMSQEQEAQTLEQIINHQNPQITQSVAAAKDMGKFYTEDYKKLIETSDRARTQLEKIRTIHSLLDESYTGTLGTEFKNMQKIAGLFGIAPESVQSKEAAESLSRQLALAYRNPAGGEGMPGSMSDFDVKFLSSIVPSLDMTPNGRKKLLEIHERVARRSQELADAAKEYVIKHGALDAGWEDIKKSIASKNLFGTDDLEIKKTPSVGWKIERER